MEMVVCAPKLPLKTFYGVYDLSLHMLEVIDISHQFIPVILSLFHQCFHAELDVI